MVTVRIPVPSSEAASNLLGTAGLVAICVAIAFLTTWVWALLAAGVFAVALSVIAATGEQRAAQVAEIGAARSRHRKAA